MFFETDAAAETRRLGRRLGELLLPSDLVALDGDLGAGKTQFTIGICDALQVTEAVSSPTFLLVNEYHSGRVPLYHFDAYRICSAEELEEIGWEEYLVQGLIVIEWAKRVEAILPRERIAVEIQRLDEISSDRRRIAITMDERIESLADLGN